MAKRNPVCIEVVQEGDERVVIYTYADGEVVRKQVEKIKPTRRPRRPPTRFSMDRTRKKQF